MAIKNKQGQLVLTKNIKKAPLKTKKNKEVMVKWVKVWWVDKESPWASYDWVIGEGASVSYKRRTDWKRGTKTVERSLLRLRKD